MFGKKESKVEDAIVPVYTVHTVPRKYELVGTVFASPVKLADKGLNALNDLGREGAKLGADAVIGMVATSTGQVGIVRYYGTAIKYLD